MLRLHVSDIVYYVVSKYNDWIDQTDECNFTYSADEISIYNEVRNGIKTSSVGTDGLDDCDESWPWEEYGDMYKRGDNAGEGWVLTR